MVLAVPKTSKRVRVTGNEGQCAATDNHQVNLKGEKKISPLRYTSPSKSSVVKVPPPATH